MSWTFDEMVSYASRGTWVRPGDVLGSDTVTLTVEGIGTVSNTVVTGADPIPLTTGRRRSRDRP